jgi:chemotaxis protein MotB
MSGHGGGGGERWLVSYADFITLLMVLFVVLYSMGQTDIQRYKQLADGLRAAFSGGPTQIIDTGIDQGGGEAEKSAAPIVIPGIPQTPVNSVEVAGQLTDLLAASNLGGSVSVQNNIEGVLISLSEKLVFTPGTAELNPSAYPVLEVIAEMLHGLENEVRIIGYTDNSLPTDPAYSTNWELSVARALKIARYLEQAGVAPHRLMIAGRGEYHPVFENDSPEHRALNSRAEIIVVYSVNNDVINLNVSPPPGSNPIHSGGTTQP